MRVGLRNHRHRRRSVRHVRYPLLGLGSRTLAGGRGADAPGAHRRSPPSPEHHGQQQEEQDEWGVTLAARDRYPVAGAGRAATPDAPQWRIARIGRAPSSHRAATPSPRTRRRPSAPCGPGAPRGPAREQRPPVVGYGFIPMVAAPCLSPLSRPLPPRAGGNLRSSGLARRTYATAPLGTIVRARR